MTKIYDHDDQYEIEGLLLGRRVVEANVEHAEGVLTLDDGTVIEVRGNEGGCSCGAGDYDVTSLATTDNIITDVRFDYCEDEHYRIFVFADNKEINLMTVEGNDGSGYYGTGYYLHVKYPS